ncbi:MAG: phosphate starvation protein PhoH [Phycisphaeraceae bacterium]|nr:MAG: phosphate starvation protein PhoH [Phycisphaeraceae bacterium]
MEITVHVPEGHDSIGVLGSAERNLKMLREMLGVRVSSRHGEVRLAGDPAEVTIARNVLERLRRDAQRSRAVSRQDVLGMIAEETDRSRPRPGGGDATGLRVYAQGRRIEPKNDTQRAYLEAIREHDLIFGVGPAGTGKTYLAVASAVHMLKEQSIGKLILCRPAVEAGERLGFLPGDLAEKVNPYLRPLLDALHDMMDYADVQRFIAADVIEVVPLAFMRGRTLNGAAIILDEAQNTTRSQMKMFLTRMGHGSKVIVTGDTTQIDLPDPADSGLIDAVRRLRRVEGVASVGFTGRDVVRHKMVQRIVDAYADTDRPDGARADARRALEMAMDPDTHAGDDAGGTEH